MPQHHRQNQTGIKQGKAPGRNPKRVLPVHGNRKGKPAIALKVNKKRNKHPYPS